MSFISIESLPKELVAKIIEGVEYEEDYQRLVLSNTIFRKCLSKKDVKNIRRKFREQTVHTPTIENIIKKLLCFCTFHPVLYKTIFRDLGVYGSMTVRRMLALPDSVSLPPCMDSKVCWDLVIFPPSVLKLKVISEDQTTQWLCLPEEVGEETDFVFKIFNKGGITIGNLIEAVYRLKCHKYDFNFELFSSIMDTQRWGKKITLHLDFYYGGKKEHRPYKRANEMIRNTERW
jgi:hypothetical protein